MSPLTSPPPYPLWLGVASFVWAVCGWTLALLAPRLAFLPGVELLHLVLPAITGALILANLWFAITWLRRGVQADRLMLVTALQLGLFTVLFHQIAAHLGASAFKLSGPATAWQWVQFSLAHALKASDVLDLIEAYGLNVQAIKHNGYLVAALLVLYHVVVDLFVLALLWAAVERARRKLLEDEDRAFLIRISLVLAFVVFLIAWVVSALWLRPWRTIDIPLWVVENLARVLDFGDALDSFDIHWHQVPREWWESTLTFLGRVWIALAIGLVVNWWTGTAHTKDDHLPSYAHAASRLAVAGLLFILFLVLPALVAVEPQQMALSLAAEAGAHENARATAALQALRRMGPNAEDAVEPLLARLGQQEPERDADLLDTIGYLGPRGLAHLALVAERPDERRALIATRGLARTGPEAAPLLVRVWRATPVAAVRQLASDSLRELGTEALPPLAEALSPENSVEFQHWFKELDRNWTLRTSSNPLFNDFAEWYRGGLQDHRNVVKGGRLGKIAVPTLVEVVASAAPEVRESAALALEEIGPAAQDAVAALITALQDADRDVRASAAAALGAIGPGAKDAIPALVIALHDGGAGVRPTPENLRAHPELKRENGIDPGGRVRGNAALALGKIGVTVQEAPALIAALQDERRVVRAGAAYALVKIGPAIVPILAARLQDASPALGASLALVLGEIGPAAKEAVPALIAALRSSAWKGKTATNSSPRFGDTSDREKLWDASAVKRFPPLANYLVAETVSEWVSAGQRARAQVVAALGKMGPEKEVVPALMAVLRDESEIGTVGDPVRTRAAAALGEMGPAAKAAVPALIAALKSGFRSGPVGVVLLVSTSSTRESAATALVKIGPATIPALMTALHDPDRGIRRGAAEVLGKIGPAAREAVPALTEALQDSSTEVRTSAREALQALQK